MFNDWCKTGTATQKVGKPEAELTCMNYLVTNKANIMRCIDSNKWNPAKKEEKKDGKKKSD